MDIDYDIIKKHSFFEGINFDRMWEQEAPMLEKYKPANSRTKDYHNFQSLIEVETTNIR